MPSRGSDRRRHQTFRSVSDNHYTYEAFSDLPDHVRHQVPQQVMHRGEIEALKPEYPSAGQGWLRAGEVRGRGVQAGGLGARKN
jgi:hypothetical protein